MKDKQVNLTASITFVPACSRCHNIIYTPAINYKEEDDRFNIDGAITHYLAKDYIIEPFSCPFCGARFTTIMIPTKFPLQTETIFRLGNNVSSLK